MRDIESYCAIHMSSWEMLEKGLSAREMSEVLVVCGICGKGYLSIHARTRV